MDQQRKETYKNLFQVRSGQGYTHSNAETSLKELDTRHEAQFDKLLLLLCSA